METTLQIGKKETDPKFEKEKQNELDKTEINEIVSRHFIWFMNNNIDEFQMFCKFWNQTFINQSLLLMRIDS